MLLVFVHGRLAHLLPSKVRGDAEEDVEAGGEVVHRGGSPRRRVLRRRGRWGGGRGRRAYVELDGGCERLRLRGRARGGGGCARSGSGSEFDTKVPPAVVDPLAGGFNLEAELHGVDSRVEYELEGAEGWERGLEGLLLVHDRSRRVELGREELPVLGHRGSNHAPVEEESERRVGLALEADGVDALGVGLDGGDELPSLGEGDADHVGDLAEDGRADGDGVSTGTGRTDDRLR